jgi:signal transduction histidine kinase
MFRNIALHIEKDMAPLAEETNRTLTFDIPQGLPILTTDGELLAKALNKLVENAVRYTEEGGQVALSAEADGELLVIRVSDDGIGMTPDEVSQLGEPYFRADNDHVRSYKGSGLGIPIAFGILKALGATVAVDSEPGNGTVITVTLKGMT